MSSEPTRSSWAIKDEAVLAELISLMDLNPTDIAMLKELHPHARTIAPQMARAFYTRLLARSETSEYFIGKPMAALHGTISDWFVDLFSGTYDSTYARKRLQIGLIHVKIGLPVRYPLAMMDVILEYGQQLVAHSSTPAQALRAFHKVLALDIAIFNQAYEDNQLKHLAELVGGERLARIVLAGITS